MLYTARNKTKRAVGARREAPTYAHRSRAFARWCVAPLMTSRDPVGDHTMSPPPPVPGAWDKPASRSRVASHAQAQASVQRQPSLSSSKRDIYSDALSPWLRASPEYLGPPDRRPTWVADKGPLDVNAPSTTIASPAFLSAIAASNTSMEESMQTDPMYTPDVDVSMPNTSTSSAAPPLNGLAIYTSSPMAQPAQEPTQSTVAGFAERMAYLRNLGYAFPAPAGSSASAEKPTRDDAQGSAPPLQYRMPSIHALRIRKSNVGLPDATEKSGSMPQAPSTRDISTTSFIYSPSTAAQHAWSPPPPLLRPSLDSMSYSIVNDSMVNEAIENMSLRDNSRLASAAEAPAPVEEPSAPQAATEKTEVVPMPAPVELPSDAHTISPGMVSPASTSPSAWYMAMHPTPSLPPVGEAWTAMSASSKRSSVASTLEPIHIVRGSPPAWATNSSLGTPSVGMTSPGIQDLQRSERPHSQIIHLPSSNRSVVRDSVLSLPDSFQPMTVPVSLSAEPADPQDTTTILRDEAPTSLPDDAHETTLVESPSNEPGKWTEVDDMLMKDASMDVAAAPAPLPTMSTSEAPTSPSTNSPDIVWSPALDSMHSLPALAVTHAAASATDAAATATQAATADTAAATAADRAPALALADEGVTPPPRPARASREAAAPPAMYEPRGPALEGYRVPSALRAADMSYAASPRHISYGARMVDDTYESPLDASYAPGHVYGMYDVSQATARDDSLLAPTTGPVHAWTETDQFAPGPIDLVTPSYQPMATLVEAAADKSMDTTAEAPLETDMPPMVRSSSPMSPPPATNHDVPTLMPALQYTMTKLPKGRRVRRSKPSSQTVPSSSTATVPPTMASSKEPTASSPPEEPTAAASPACPPRTLLLVDAPTPPRPANPRVVSHIRRKPVPVATVADEEEEEASMVHPRRPTEAVAEPSVPAKEPSMPALGPTTSGPRTADISLVDVSSSPWRSDYGGVRPALAPIPMGPVRSKEGTNVWLDSHDQHTGDTSHLSMLGAVADALPTFNLEDYFEASLQRIRIDTSGHPTPVKSGPTSFTRQGVPTSQPLVTRPPTDLFRHAPPVTMRVIGSPVMGLDEFSYVMDEDGIILRSPDPGAGSDGQARGGTEADAVPSLPPLDPYLPEEHEWMGDVPRPPRTRAAWAYKDGTDPVWDEALFMDTKLPRDFITKPNSVLARGRPVKKTEHTSIFYASLPEKRHRRRRGPMPQRAPPLKVMNFDEADEDEDDVHPSAFMDTSLPAPAPVADPSAHAPPPATATYMGDYAEAPRTTGVRKDPTMTSPPLPPLPTETPQMPTHTDFGPTQDATTPRKSGQDNKFSSWWKRHKPSPTKSTFPPNAEEAPVGAEPDYAEDEMPTHTQRDAAYGAEAAPPSMMRPSASTATTTTLKLGRRTAPPGFEPSQPGKYYLAGTVSLPSLNVARTAEQRARNETGLPETEPALIQSLLAAPSSSTVRARAGIIKALPFNPEVVPPTGQVLVVEERKILIRPVM